MVYLVMTRSHFYTCLFFLLPIFYYLSLPITVGDMAGWTAHGRYALSEMSLLTTDIYSVLPTKPMVYPVLLPLIYGVIDFLGGLELVSLFHKLVLFFILLAIYKNSLGKMKNVVSVKNILYILFFFSGIAFYFIDRPALVVFLYLVLSYVLIENEENYDFVFFLKLALLLVLWVNMHGSWPLLVIMLGWKFLFITRRNNYIKNIGILMSLCLLSFLNPFGYVVWPYIFETATISKLRKLDEWNITNLQDFYPQGYIFYITVLIFIFVVLRKLFKEKNTKILSSPIFILMIMGFVTIRNVGLYNFVLLPFLYKYSFLSDALPELPVTTFLKKKLNLLIVLVLGLLCLSQTPYFKAQSIPYFMNLVSAKKAEVFDNAAPLIFVKYIENTKNNAAILNDWEYGSYLLYRLPNKILIDTRNIIYYQSDFDEYLKIMSGVDYWPDYADKYKFGFIMLNKKIRENLINKIKASANWKLALENRDTILFERK